MCIYKGNKTGRPDTARESEKENTLKLFVEKVSTHSNGKQKFDYQQESPHAKAGKELKEALKKAQRESRLVVGVSAVVKFLSLATEDSLLCILASPKSGDSATHIQEVLLKAFCLENDIYTIQVDSMEKLSRVLNMESQAGCILMQKSRDGPESLSPSEIAVIDFCEENWDAPQQPIFELPDT